VLVQGFAYGAPLAWPTVRSPVRFAVPRESLAVVPDGMMLRPTRSVARYAVCKPNTADHCVDGYYPAEPILEMSPNAKRS